MGYEMSSIASSYPAEKMKLQARRAQRKRMTCLILSRRRFYESGLCYQLNNIIFIRVGSYEPDFSLPPSPPLIPLLFCAFTKWFRF